MDRPPPILTKQQNLDLYIKGAFGNRDEIWPNLNAFCIEVTKLISAGEFHGYNSNYVLRYAGSTSGKRWCDYSVPYNEILPIALHWTSQGAIYDLIYIHRAPADRDRYLLLQGELMIWKGELYLYGSRTTLKMRDALKADAHEWWGLQVRMLMRQNLDPASYDCVMELLDLYPDHVIEFSCWSIQVGVTPGRNTIVWEVRRY
jgi:hypothetical protein